MKNISKRALAMLLCLAMLAGFLPGISNVAVTATAQETNKENLLAEFNPGFEAAVEINGWTVSDSTAVFQSDMAAKDSTLALKVKDTSNTAGNNAISAAVAVAQGETYAATVDVYGKAQAALTIRFYGEDGAELTDKAVSKVVETPKNEWQTLEIRTIAPEGAVTAAIELATTAEGVGEAYFDNASFYMVPLVISFENFSFEGDFDAEAAAPEGWTGGGVTNAHLLRSINTEPAYVHRGKQSLKLTAQLNSSNKNITTGITSNVINVYAKRYRYSAWLKSEGESRGQIYIAFYNAKGEMLDKNGKVISSGYTYSIGVDVTTEWKDFTDVITAPNGAVRATMGVFTNTATKASIYADEVTLKPDNVAAELPNPSFDEGFQSNGIPTGWTTLGYAKYMQHVEDEKTNGQYALKVDTTAEPNNSGVTVTLPVGEGDVWKLSGDMKGAGQMALQYKSAAGTVLSSTIVKPDADNAAWQTKEIVMEAKTTDQGEPAQMTITWYVSKSAPGVGYADNLKLERITAGEVKLYRNVLVNSGFESKNSIPGWTGMDFRHTITEEYAGGDRGNFVMKLTDEKTTLGASIQTPRVPAAEGKYYRVTVENRRTTDMQLYIRFFDKDGNQLSPSPSITLSANSAWSTDTIVAKAPDGAASVVGICALSLIAVGTAHVDNFIVAEHDPQNDPDYEGMVSLKSPGWSEIDYKNLSHPRLYFNAAELEEMKESVSFGLINDFGYSTKQAYEDMLIEADEYVTEKTLRVNWGRLEEDYWYDLIEMPDPNGIDLLQVTYEDLGTPYSYNLGITDRVLDKIQVLALAYALTGDTKYSDRAINYVTKMAEWDNWMQVALTPWYSSNMEVGYVTIALSTVYDMCYDQLTKAQREQISTAIFEKGIKPCSGDLQVLNSFNPYMVRVNAMLIGTCAILDESNREQLEPYLTWGYNYVRWYLDKAATSGQTEGYSYTDHALSNAIEGINILSRVTNKSGFMDHEFFEEILVDWVLYAMRPGDGAVPPISDTSVDTRPFFATMMLLNKNTGNAKAGYYLKMSGLSETATNFQKVLYSSANPQIAEEEDVYQPLTHVKQFGYGYLRSGFGALDVCMTVVSSKTRENHSHFDANHFVLAFNRLEMLTDFGYAIIAYGSEHPGYIYGYQYAHNVILVDGEAQTVRGEGELTTKMDNPLYGHLMGSAAGAYGGTLSQADRHFIFLNHTEKPYYVLIDELDSTSAHEYTWNLNIGSFNGLEIDSKPSDLGTKAEANRIAITKDRDTTFLHFVGNDKLDMEVLLYEDIYGPLIQTDSPKAKEYQFMTVINADAETCKDDIVYFGNILSGYLYGQTNKPTDKIIWKTSYRFGSEVLKPVFSGGYKGLFFRGAAAGDYYEIPFEIETGGYYKVQLSMALSPVYGDYKIYLDGVECPEIFYGYFPAEKFTNYTIGTMDIAAGSHTLRFECVGKNEKSTDYLISCAGVILVDPNKPQAVSQVNVTETYDNENVLGAKISYGTVLSDIVLYNRTKDLIAAGDVVSDGEETTIMGVHSGTEINEGYAIIDGTSLKFGGTQLVSANGKISLAVDYRWAKKPIKNNDEEGEEPEIDEDVDYTIPQTIVTTSATATRNVSVYVGNDVPYTVAIGNTVVESVYENGIVTFDVPAGDHEIIITGTHTCVFDQQVTELAFLAGTRVCNEAQKYYFSCICGEHGTETFEYGNVMSHSWDDGRITKRATCSHEGVMTYTCGNCSETKTEAIPVAGHTLVEANGKWSCTVCGKMFADAEGKNEIGATNVVVIVIVAVAAVAVVGGGVTLFVLAKKGKLKSRKKETE